MRKFHYLPAFFAICAALLLSALHIGRVEAREEVSTQDATFLWLSRAADMRLATMGYRLSVANAALCDQLEPGHGMQPILLQLYAPTARPVVASYFKISGPIGVLDVVPDSPAAKAGLRAGDTITYFGGVPLPQSAEGPASTDQLADFWSAVAQLPSDQAIEVAVLRDAVPMRFTVHPVPACRTRYELSLSDMMDAAADGSYVRISNGYLTRFPGDLLAPVVAHELAHNMLRHQQRLREAGAHFGLLSGVGRNLGLFRQAEIEADALAVHLLARAGYPADTASRFRMHPKVKSMSSIFHGRSHPHWKDRLRIAQAEERRIAEWQATHGELPPAPFITTRDTPLTGNWRPLLSPS